MNWAPRVGRIRGMDIRFHLTLLAVVTYWILDGAQRGGWSGVWLALLFGVALGINILWHELGHAWASRRSGLRVEAILLWPLGGECQIASGMPNPRTEIFVALAGPAAGLLLTVAALTALILLGRFQPVGLLSFFGAGSWLTSLAAIGLWLTVFNLIPTFPLDGGQALRGLLTFRLGEVRATLIAARIGQVMAGIYLVLALLFNQFLLAALAVYIFIGAERALRGVMYTGHAYDPDARDPYFRSLGIQEDWSREAQSREGQQPGFFGRWLRRRQARRAERAERHRSGLQAEVDRILEKVSREGLPALTAKEKRLLNEASQNYRETDRR
jgi:stage IV sporulation protein FB